eukprot:scaffold86744_cov21-Prasinocladus_malaysianus.AAC.1
MQYCPMQFATIQRNVMQCNQNLTICICGSQSRIMDKSLYVAFAQLRFAVLPGPPSELHRQQEGGRVLSALRGGRERHNHSQRWRRVAALTKHPTDEVRSTFLPSPWFKLIHSVSCFERSVRGVARVTLRELRTKAALDEGLAVYRDDSKDPAKLYYSTGFCHRFYWWTVTGFKTARQARASGTVIWSHTCTEMTRACGA